VIRGSAVKSHRDLDVWRDAIDLVEQMYRITAGFPVEERYGLTSQMRRAAVSIPANIAEGAARGGRKEYVHFLCMARGSISELETLLIVSRRLALCGSDAETDELLGRVFARLNALIRRLDQPRPEK